MPLTLAALWTFCVVLCCHVKFVLAYVQMVSLLDEGGALQNPALLVALLSDVSVCVCVCVCVWGGGGGGGGGHLHCFFSAVL